MSSATQDRQTPRRERGLTLLPVAAATVIRMGCIVCANADGYAVEGATATDLIYLGRADTSANNAGGLDGELSVLVRSDSQFLWDNHAGDPVTQAQLGMDCWIVDNQTVAATDGGGTRSRAGRVAEVTNEGVWVE